MLKVLDGVYLAKLIDREVALTVKLDQLGDELFPFQASISMRHP